MSQQQSYEHAFLPFPLTEWGEISGKRVFPLNGEIIFEFEIQISPNSIRISLLFYPNFLV
uniref:Uncharacterized protein n=1 Tax=Solanum tuberosum TaxID=4113 RepID=M1CMR1_SOLTU